MRLLFKVLSFLPLVVLHGAGWVLGWLVFLLSARYRGRLIANARQAGVVRADWTKSVGAAGQLVAELPRLWAGTPVALEWSGAEHIEDALRLG